ncbi:MAG: hypothetical protein ACRC6X_06650 [Culicoidibacterales bacterium]
MLIYLTIFCVISTSLVINMHALAAQNAIKTNLAPIATIESNYSVVAAETDKKIDSLTAKMTTRLSKAEGVVHYDYASSAFLLLKGINFVSDELAATTEDEPMLITGTQQIEELIQQNGVTGKHFSQVDILEGLPKVIISTELASSNNLNIGDMLSAKNTGDDSNEVMPLEIIGLFKARVTDTVKTSKKGATEFERINNKREYNRIYIPNNYLAKLGDNNSVKAVGGDEDIVVSEAVFKLSSSADMAIFSHLAAEILPPGHKVIFNTDDFDRIAGSLVFLANMATQVRLYTLGFAFVILCLAVLGFLRPRQNEFVILLSMGRTKFKLGSQLLLEFSLMALLPIIVVLLTTNALGTTIADLIINDTATYSQEVPTTNAFLLKYAPKLDANEIQIAYKSPISLAETGIIFVQIVGMMMAIIPAFFIYIWQLSPKKRLE